MEFKYNRVIDNWFQTNNMFCTIDKGFSGGYGIYYTIVEKKRSTKEGKRSPEIILHDYFLWIYRRAELSTLSITKSQDISFM